jgi:predicted kinase
MYNVTVMVGVPAMGKSTYINKNAGDAFVYSTDDHITKMAEEQNTTYDAIWLDSIKEATGFMNEAVAKVIAEGGDVVWDQTNVSVKKRRSVMSRFSKKYFKTCVCFVPPFEEAKWNEWDKRLDNREGKMIKPFVRYNMLANYETPTLEEGFDRIEFYNMDGEMTLVVTK